MYRGSEVMMVQDSFWISLYLVYQENAADSTFKLKVCCCCISTWAAAHSSTAESQLMPTNGKDCVCVCVCVWERERDSETLQWLKQNLSHSRDIQRFSVILSDSVIFECVCWTSACFMFTRWWDKLSHSAVKSRWTEDFTGDSIYKRSTSDF